DVYINGTNIGAVTVTADDSTGALVSAINFQSSSTGVTASKSSSGDLVLNAADGRNITVTAASSAWTILGLTAQSGSTSIYRSDVQLDSQSQITITGNLSNLYSTNNVKDTTDNSKAIATDTTDFNVGKIAIDTQVHAEAAILTIDAALNQLDSINANIGAIQNRLGFTVANLQTGSQNMASAQSTIMDADFAAETANFQKNQILVQAGTAMIAQANTLPQIALQLLK
ncbi:MAG: flagellin, partial [Nitrospirae bacterium]|nr:flagellin [Nitrospirota bacterium]